MEACVCDGGERRHEAHCFFGSSLLWFGGAASGCVIGSGIGPGCFVLRASPPKKNKTKNKTLFFPGTGRFE
jgi:hypothetical protein